MSSIFQVWARGEMVLAELTLNLTLSDVILALLTIGAKMPLSGFYACRSDENCWMATKHK